MDRIQVAMEVLRCADRVNDAEIIQEAVKVIKDYLKYGK